MTDALLPGSAKSEEQHSREICIAGRWLYERGYIVACEGNLSVRLDENRILNTPTCMNKGTLSPEDLVITDLNGAHISGKRKVSSEVAMHSVVLSHAPGRAGHLPCTPADGNWFCRGRPRAGPGAAAGSDYRLGANSPGALCNSGNAGIECRD